MGLEVGGGGEEGGVGIVEGHDFLEQSFSQSEGIACTWVNVQYIPLSVLGCFFFS